MDGWNIEQKFDCCVLFSERGLGINEPTEVCTICHTNSGLFLPIQVYNWSKPRTLAIAKMVYKRGPQVPWYGREGWARPPS